MEFESLPLGLEVLPVVPDVSELPDAPVLEPVVPVLPEVLGEAALESDDVSEVPEELMPLVLPEGERAVLLPLRPCGKLESLDRLLLVSVDDEVSDPVVAVELLPFD